MRRLVLSFVWVAGLALSGYSDVTVRQTTDGKGLGFSGKSAGVTYIKGGKMRTDMVQGNKTQTAIFDLEAQKMYTFDSKKKEANVWNMAELSEEISKSVDMSSMKASIKPNGQTKQIGSHTAAGYDMEISIQAAMGGSKDMVMTVTLAGPMWVVKDAPGTADYNRFYRAAAEKGFIFTDPAAAKAQPGSAKAMAEMYKKMSDIGGIPYEIDMQIKMGGSGPMGAIFARMGNVSMTTVVDSVETNALPDDLFAPPQDYKLKEKK